MIKVKVFHGTELARTYLAEDYEEQFENGYDVLYIMKQGYRAKAVTMGDFGSGYWGYEVEEA